MLFNLFSCFRFRFCFRHGPGVLTPPAFALWAALAVVLAAGAAAAQVGGGTSPPPTAAAPPPPAPPPSAPAPAAASGTGSAPALEDEPLPPAFSAPPAAAPGSPPSMPGAAGVPATPPAPPPPRAAGPGPDTLGDFDTPAVAARAESVPTGPSLSRSTGTPTLPSLVGALGLFRTSTAEVGPLYQLRLGLHGEYFSASGFLVEGDSNQRLQGGLTTGFTIHPKVEIFAALLNSNNRNRRIRESGDRDPELIKSFGDLVLGGKGVWALSPDATVGFEVGLKFLSSISGLAFSADSTSLWLGPVFTYDARRVLHAMPLRFHANAGYYADNSSNLHGLENTTEFTKEVAMFAYGIAGSRLRLALAADAPFENLVPGFSLYPFVEYHVEYVTSGADPTFRAYMPPFCDPSGQTGRECIDNRDMQWLTFGARAAVYKGITVDLGFDVRVRSPGFPYGPPLPPYNVLFGLSYPLDIDSFTRPVVVTRTVDRKEPPQGQVAGVVRSAQGGAPIPGAIVAVAGRPRARAATDGDGGFATATLPPGQAELEVTAADFEPAKVTTEVRPGKPIELAIALTPKPATGNVRGRLADDAGKGIEGLVKFTGAESFEARTGGDGVFAQALPVGTYQVRAEAPGLPPREAEVNVLVGQDKMLELVMRVPAPNPDVVLAGERIRLKRAVRFKVPGNEIVPASQKVLDGVADVLALHPEIRRVRIEAHWDSSVPKPEAAELTRQQAEAVRGYLVARGVAGARLGAVGVGSAKPLVPNLSPMSRRRNRRVELYLE